MNNNYKRRFELCALEYAVVVVFKTPSSRQKKKLRKWVLKHENNDVFSVPFRKTGEFNFN